MTYFLDLCVRIKHLSGGQTTRGELGGHQQNNGGAVCCQGKKNGGVVAGVPEVGGS